MYNLITIGDPVIDTHVQIADNSSDCKIIEDTNKYLALTYGAKIPIVDSFQNLGGNAANVAAAGVKLGLKTAMISTIGDDFNGKMVLDFLKQFGVDNSLITTEAGTSTRYSIVLNYHQERTLLSYSEKRNYIWPEPIPGTEWIYYTGLSEGYEEMQKKLIEYLDSHPTVRLAINPGSYMLKYALPALKDVVARADVLIVNLEESERIAGKPVEEEKSEAALIHELLALGVKEVALTDGSRGAWAGNAEEIFYLKAYPVKVVAKTGAGDAFSTGYLTARMHDHDIAHALEWGSANSAGVVQKHGAHAGLLDVKGVATMLKKFEDNKPEQLV